MINETASRYAGFKVLDWDATAQVASRLTTDSLHYGILDCVEVAKVGVQTDSGYYMDQACVYRAEVNVRRCETMAQQAGDEDKRLARLNKR
jgi:hypothetical protein